MGRNRVVGEAIAAAFRSLEFSTELKAVRRIGPVAEGSVSFVGILKAAQILEQSITFVLVTRGCDAAVARARLTLREAASRATT